jgi:hypothetical protein
MTQPHFRVGQRVLCIDASPNPLCRAIPLVRRRIYTIRAIARGNWKPKPPGWGVHLEGVYIFYPRTNGALLWAFHPQRFAAVVERKTDIRIFEEIAAGQLRLPLTDDMEGGVRL